MNQRQWERVARPVVLDLAAVLEEFNMGVVGPADFGEALCRRYKAAARRHDIKALRSTCTAIKQEARRRWLAQQQREAA